MSSCFQFSMHFKYNFLNVFECNVVPPVKHFALPCVYSNKLALSKKIILKYLINVWYDWSLWLKPITTCFLSSLVILCRCPNWSLLNSLPVSEPSHSPSFSSSAGATSPASWRFTPVVGESAPPSLFCLMLSAGNVWPLMW